MATEVTAPSSSAEHSAGKELNDNFSEQLVNALKPRDYIITVSFVTASELFSDDLESLKASIALVLHHPEMKCSTNKASEHLTKHFQTPVREVNLSVNILGDNIMASSAEHDSPTSISDDATPPAEQVVQDGSITSEDVAKASKKVPRPPNAFIIYRKEWHPTIVAANPGLHNNDICM